MKYETPHLTALAPAISAIQDPHISKSIPSTEEVALDRGLSVSYSDWE
jgi:hypothetical protein